VYVNFNGSLAGTTYTLGAGEIDNSSSFRSNGAAAVSAGVGDVPGDVNNSSGFFFDSTALGNLRTQNWITEARFSPDVPVAQQPTATNWNHILDVQGDTFFRFNGQTPPKITQFGYWDGSTEPAVTAPNPPANQYSHIALVWDAANTSLQAFVNGVSQGTADANAFEVPSANVGYGFFSRTGFLNRAVDGKLDAVAFSTFTGTFNPATDFQLPVPEPNTLVLLTISSAALAWALTKRASRQPDGAR
jgi:hypothetical protein